MKIVVLGASGMIGRYLSNSLRQNGHTVIEASRSSTEFKLDLQRLPEESQLIEKLIGIDCVCNCIGIAPGFEAEKQFLVHYHAMKQVLDAAKKANVKKIIQISALSNAVGTDLDIPYLASKYRLDKELLENHPPHLSVAIIRPSLVYAPTGLSTIGFLRMAHLPYLALPNKGRMMIQPIHVTDLCAFINELLTQGNKNKIYEIGGTALSLASYINHLRPNPKRKIFGVPDLISRLGMFFLHYIEPAIGGVNAYRLLLAGSTTSKNQFEIILKRKAIEPQDFHQTDLDLLKAAKGSGNHDDSK